MSIFIPIPKKVKVKVKSLSRVQLFLTPWTAAYQALPSMGFSRQEYWSGLPFPSPGDLPEPGINQGLLHCRQMLYHLSYQGSPSPKKGNAKECSIYRTIALISQASKVLLKILQARLQQYVYQNFQMFKLVLEKAEEPEIKLSTSAGSWKK